MTRINVGIQASELCDQHLIAEYRELPRLWGRTSPSKTPTEFKLGSGHCLWCQQYQGMLYDRFVSLVQEMKHRGFHVSFPDPPAQAKYGMRPSPKEIKMARIIVLNRLNEKLSIMKQEPRWTNRKRSLCYRKPAKL